VSPACDIKTRRHRFIRPLPLVRPGSKSVLNFVVLILGVGLTLNLTLPGLAGTRDSAVAGQVGGMVIIRC
jgi:hypothetical protein